MRTYVLIISDTFPEYHNKAGKPTFFEDLINIGEKKHTIRQNYDFWSKRIKNIQADKAVLSVRKWTGKPYRSKQKELFQFTSDDGVGIESVDFSKTYKVISRNGDLGPLIRLLARNDGLTLDEFHNWFGDYGFNGKMAIIHFTPFRYRLISPFINSYVPLTINH